MDRYSTSFRPGVPSPLSSHPNPPNTRPTPVPSSGSSSVGGERGRFIRSWAVYGAIIAPERMRRADSVVVQRRIWPPWTCVVRSRVAWAVGLVGGKGGLTREVPG